MDLPCLPVETPSPASSGSTDPLYDNCPPYYAQRGRERTCCPAVTGLPAAPLPALTPAVADVPTLVGGRGPGARPDQSYCSWGGGLARLAWGWGRGRARVGGGGGGHSAGEEGEAVHQNPSPAASEEHESALSVYDNLRDAPTPDDRPGEIVPMETAFLEPSPAEGGGESRSGSSDPGQGPELGSGACVFELYQQTHRVAALHRSNQTGLRVQLPPAAAVDQHPEELCPQGARVPPPVPLADPSASALRRLLTSIQQQIVRQREEYEARILSLEQRNDELQQQVLGLRANLAQQRRWYQAVQAKILGSERARDAAELHNAALQTEMEQYFDSFGELNNEATKTERIVKSF